MKLGMDSYSLRWQGWTPFQFLDFADELRLDSIQFSGRQYFQSLDRDYLLSVKRYGEERGIGIEVGIGSFDSLSVTFRPANGTAEQQLTEMIRAAAIVGSPVVRCFLGSQADRLTDLPIERHIEECIRTLKAVAPVARDLGVKVAVENHGGVDLLARELRELVLAAGKDYVGVCLDTGNPAYAGEDPVVTTEVLADLTVTTHVRDNRVWAIPEGAMAQWVPMGKGNTDLKTIIAILKAKAPGAVVQLEIITGSNPITLTYNQPDSPFWKMFPGMLARDFARYLKLASTGRPGALEQLIAPRGDALPEGETGEQLRAQQRRDFAESARYCHEVLEIGERA